MLHLFSLPFHSAWHDSHCIGGCSYGSQRVPEQGDIYNCGATAGAGTQTSPHPHLHLQTAALPCFPFTPMAPWKGALSDWSTEVKAWTLPALSAQGPAHCIHTERKGSMAILTSAAHAGSPALQACVGQKRRTGHVWPPVGILHPRSGQRARWLGDPLGALPRGGDPASHWPGKQSLDEHLTPT